MVKHVLSKMVETNAEIARTINKHSLMEIEDRIVYIVSKIVKYQTVSYPYNTLLILDDAAGWPLLKKNISELCGFFTKTCHYNFTFIIAVQTLRFVYLDVKKFATDIICCNGLNKEDFTSMLQQTPHSLGIKATTAEHLNHNGQHDCFIIDITSNESHFEV